MTFSITAIIAMLQAGIAAAPGIIQTVEDLYDLAQKIFAAVNGRVPTDQEMADLQTQIDADVADALTPLPPDTGPVGPVNTTS